MNAENQEEPGPRVTAFVSYAREDFDFVQRLESALRSDLGAVAQSLLMEPVTQETSPLIAALAINGWRMGRTSDSWNGMQRVPLIVDLGSASETELEEISALIPNRDGRTFLTLDANGTISAWAVPGGALTNCIKAKSVITAMASARRERSVQLAR